MKICEEKKLMKSMIKLYTKKHYRDNNHKKFQELYEYSSTKLDKCPFNDKKGQCRNCEIHCYSPKYKDEFKKIMRYSGKYMLLKHPVLTIKHLLDK